MAVGKRTLREVTLTFDKDGAPSVTVTGIAEDLDEGTSTGVARVMVAPAVVNAAVALRDVILTVAAAAGKPLTF